MSRAYLREASIGAAILALGVLMALVRPAYFDHANLIDVFLANLPVLIVALGMTLVIVAGEIDISVGSTFAVCAVCAGVLAKAGLPVPVVCVVVCLIGGGVGWINGLLVAHLRLPAIVVTLAMMIALRDALRWITQGAWVEDLPSTFQWMGLSQQAYPFAAGAIAGLLFLLAGWTMSMTRAGRLVYATGSNADAARLAGFPPAMVKTTAFVCVGALTGLASMINAMRFNQIPANSGLGLELKVIAAVIIGGTAITGGRGTIGGTFLGVVLIGMLGPALTFLGVSAYWERAIQGAIILIAVAVDVLPRSLARHGADVRTARA